MYLQVIPAYVYKIEIIETKEYYFGYRKFNQKLKLNPIDDFLINYFSSNKKINQIIQERGINTITGEILYENIDAEKVYWKEQELIRNHFDDPRLLNKYYNKKENGHRIFIPTKDSLKRMIDTRRRRRKAGLHPDWLRKQQEGHSKRYLVTPPNSEPYEIVNLKEHCQKHNLNHSAMSQVGQGKKPQHKGWLCKRLS